MLRPKLVLPTEEHSIPDLYLSAVVLLMDEFFITFIDVM